MVIRLATTALFCALVLACGYDSSDPPHTKLRVTVLGDVDGDGWRDLALVDDYAFRHEGARATIVSTRHGTILSIVPDVHDVVGDVGDVDGDGLSDFGIEAGEFDRPRFVVVSAATDKAIHRLDPPRTGLDFAASCAPIGDIDGDGVADFVVGSPNGVNQKVLGGVRAHSGATAELLWEILGDVEKDGFGAWLKPTRDRSGETFERFLVGSSQFYARPYCLLVDARSGDVLSTYNPSIAAGHDYSCPPCEEGSADLPLLVQTISYERGARVVREQWFAGPCGGLLADQPPQRPYTLHVTGDLDGDGVRDLLAREPPWSWAVLSAGGRKEFDKHWTPSRLHVMSADLDGDTWDEAVVVENQKIPPKGDPQRGLASVTVLSGKGGGVLVRWRREPNGDLVKLLPLLPR